MWKAFAKECAIVTHSRLEDDGKGGLKVAGELAEPYIVRPTSETTSLVPRLPAGSILTGIYRCLSTSGRMSFVGTADTFYSCVQQNSCGRKVTPVHATRGRSSRRDDEDAGCLCYFLQKNIWLSRVKGEKTDSERFQEQSHVLYRIHDAG